MKTIENKTKKELMPLDMVRALTIEKGVDKASNKSKAWNKIIKGYNGPYYIPTANDVKRLYKLSLIEILEIEGVKRVINQNKQPLPLNKLKSVFIPNIETEGNLYKNWDNASSAFIDDKYYIPAASVVKRVYGITTTELIGFNNNKVNYLSLNEALKVVGKITSGKEWNKKAKIFNHSTKSKNRIPLYTMFQRVYGKTFGELIFNLKINRKLKPAHINLMMDFMLEKGILGETGNLAIFWNEKRKEFSNDIYYIPASNHLFKIYGKSLGEILCGIRNSKYTNLLSKINIKLEDLCLLDKVQLLQIAFLKKLPKDIYKEILECPKGEERRKLLENLPERLEAIKEGEDSKTFEDSLDEEIEATEKIQDEEEKKFKKELKTGIDLINKPIKFNPEDRIKEILGGIKALDNLEGDYNGQEAMEFLMSSEIWKLWNVANQTSRQEMSKLIEEYMLKKNGGSFFNEVISTFLRQYQVVWEFDIPKGYSFPYEPFMMQKLTALMISERRQFANWSETGSGKTISGVLTSRYIDSRITLVVAVNSTVSNWTENAIRQAYPNSKVYTKKHISGETKLDTNFYNYVVVNYEEFQNPDKYVTKWKPFLENNRVDFVILDEVQLVKVKTTGTISNRRKIIDNILQDIDLQHGRNLEKEGRVVPVLALSATPVINSLNEVLSLLSLLTGVEFDPVKRTTRRSALGCHFELTKHGIRLTEELPAAERLITFPIKREFSDLSRIGSGISAINKIDTSSCLLKIGECTRGGYLQKGVKTLIYTDLVTNVIDNMVQYLQVSGFKVGEFTGRNERTRYQDMNEFINGNLDVLIASKPISTGVDGLQKICNRIIVLIPAWTYAEYHQLVGRLNRKGTEFSEVEIIIPTVEFVKNNGDSWSLDIERLTRIKFKKSLADVTINGNIPDEVITNEQALRMAKNSLTEFLKNDSYKSSVEVPVVADEIRLTKKPRIRGDRNQRDYFSEFQGINQRISTSTVDRVFTKIIKNEEDWRRYHELRNKAIGDIQDQTINVIVRDLLKSRKHKIIADMGCGMNQLKTLLPNNYEVISVDMYAADETVKICNIINTSSIIPDNSLDVVVYSLSLWSRNWRDILTDAYRALDYDGKVIIAEPVSSSSKSIDKVKLALMEKGFTNISVTIDANDKYYYMTANK